MSSDICNDSPQHPADPDTGLLTRSIPSTPPLESDPSAGSSDSPAAGAAATAKAKVQNVASTAVESGCQVLDPAQSLVYCAGEAADTVKAEGQQATVDFKDTADTARQNVQSAT